MMCCVLDQITGTSSPQNTQGRFRKKRPCVNLSPAESYDVRQDHFYANEGLP